MCEAGYTSAGTGDTCARKGIAGLPEPVRLETRRIDLLAAMLARSKRHPVHSMPCKHVQRQRRFVGGHAVRPLPGWHGHGHVRGQPGNQRLRPYVTMPRPTWACSVSSLVLTMRVSSVHLEHG